MGKVKLFGIVLNENCLYMVPDANGRLTVSGRITITLSDGVQVNYLKVRLTGESRCEWTERSNNTTTHCRSVDRIVDVEQILMNKASGAPDHLGAGQHSIPFAIHLQSVRHLPSTLIGSRYGKITYELSAKMDRVGKIFDDRSTLPLIVRNPPPITLSQLRPVGAETEHTDCCLCCASGPVVVQATFDRVAMCLDSRDTIGVTLRIDNFKQKRLVPYVYLEQRATFHVKHKTRSATLKMCQAGGSIVEAGTRGNDVRLTLGPVAGDAVGTIDSSANIRVMYVAVVAFKGSRCKLVMPFLVGKQRQPEASVDPPQYSAAAYPQPLVEFKQS